MIKTVCRECGSAMVMGQLWAMRDTKTQKWEVMDSQIDPLLPHQPEVRYFCFDCETNTRVNVRDAR
jgi:RNase P subunit RPR2